MRITSIRYEQLHSIAQYEHEKFYMEAALDDGENAAVKMQDIRHLVEDQVNQADLERELRRERQALEWEAQHGQFSVMQVGETWVKKDVAMVITEKNELDIHAHPEDNPDDIQTFTAMEVRGWYKANCEPGDMGYDPFREE